MDPASHILSKDSRWKNDKIQQCLSFTPRIANLRILKLCPAPTRLKFCEGAVLLLRDQSNLPTSMPHLRTQSLADIFQPNVFSQLEAREQSLSSFADLCSSAGSWQLWSLPKCFFGLLFSSWHHRGHPPISIKVIGPLEANRCSQLNAEKRLTIKLLYS